MKSVKSGKESGQRPVFSRRVGSLEVAVFEFSGESGRLSHTVKLTYSFRRKDSETWEVSEYLPTSELLAAAKLLDIAHTEILERSEGRVRKP